MYKLAFIALALIAQYLLSWYANFTGKLADSGKFLGFTYDSPLARAFFTQIEYVWLLIIINFCFSLSFKLGFLSFNNFLVQIIIWNAMAPVAFIAFSMIHLKEKPNVTIMVGLALVIIGAILVVANKEITAYFASEQL